MTTTIGEQSMATTGVALEVVRCKTVHDADGAMCRDCGTVFGRLWFEPVPWTWRKSQWMHENGTGHKMDLFKVAS